MATQEQDMQVVTRSSVILREPDNWSKWLFTRKISADRNGLWEYVDPDLTAETLKKTGRRETKRAGSEEV